MHVLKADNEVVFISLHEEVVNQMKESLDNISNQDRNKKQKVEEVFHKVASNDIKAIEKVTNASKFDVQLLGF